MCDNAKMARHWCRESGGLGAHYLGATEKYGASGVIDAVYVEEVMHLNVRDQVARNYDEIFTNLVLNCSQHIRSIQLLVQLHHCHNNH